MSIDLKNVRKTLLSDHNRVRNLHDAESLKANSDLDASAQKWADELAKINRLQHSSDTFKGNPAGENIFYAYHSAKSPNEIAVGATGSWYSEVDKFNVKTPESALSSGCGHFTQVVWKASKEVGFGVARSSDGGVYVVGQYYPAGNFIGQVGKNVAPPKDGKRAQFAADSKPSGASGSGASGTPASHGESIRKETKREVKETIIDGKRVRKTITIETEHFANGSTRTSTRTQTEHMN